MRTRNIEMELKQGILRRDDDEVFDIKRGKFVHCATEAERNAVLAQNESERSRYRQPQISPDAEAKLAAKVAELL